MERYRPSPDITLCCYRKTTKKVYIIHGTGKKKKTAPRPVATYGFQYIDREKRRYGKMKRPVQLKHIYREIWTKKGKNRYLAWYWKFVVFLFSTVRQ